MQGLLAAMLAIALTASAGCSFHAPGSSAPQDGVDPVDGATTPTVDAGPKCAGYETSYNGHKYRLSQGGMTWDQAKASCDTSGGYLLKIETQAEDNQATVLLALTTSEVWIGLRDVNLNGAYVWTDGTATSFTHWSGMVPNSGDPDCIVKIASFQTDDRWYARSCTDMRRAVCECNP